jgi:hypothetical protein
MPDPLQRQPEQPPALLSSTSQIAGAAAARCAGGRRMQIIALLRERPRALFELAEAMGVFDHQISGRITDLKRDGVIEATGERRAKPDTNCPADVYRLCRDFEEGIPDPALMPEEEFARLGKPPAPPSSVTPGSQYPATLLIDNQPYDRQELLPQESYPGMPYARRADTGGARLIVRVELVECGGCGKPLKQVIETKGNDPVKTYRCGTPDCNRTWTPLIVHAPGQPKLLAMVMQTH